jgi:hypothetical protein
VVNSLLVLMLSSTPLLQDPTRPLGLAPEALLSDSPTVSVVAQQEHRLQAVVYSGDTASAIIDGRLYRQGDQVGAYRLAAIKRQQVRLEAQGETLELSVFSPLTSQDMQ